LPRPKDHAANRATAPAVALPVTVQGRAVQAAQVATLAQDRGQKVESAREAGRAGRALAPEQSAAALAAGRAVWFGVLEWEAGRATGLGALGQEADQVPDLRALG
jgi:hypothetical protein